MGQRANYVLVDEGGWSLHYSHWSANTVDKDMFWGPEHAAAFIRAQTPTTEWLDEVWCEGGALLDLPKRELLFFGGEDICYEPLRQCYQLALMRRIWSGWTVRWAMEGLGELADHLGLSRELVRSKRPPELPFESRHFAQDRPSRESVVSIIDQQGRCTLHVLSQRARELSRFSLESLDWIRHGGGHPARTLSLHGDDAIRGGLHFDLRTRTIDAWFAGFEHDFFHDAGAAFPGWEIRFQGVDFESHAKLTGGALRFILPSPETVRVELCTSLLGHSRFDPSRLLRDIQAAHPGQDVQVNPLFFVHNPVAFDDRDREATLARALDGFLPPWQQTRA